MSTALCTLCRRQNVLAVMQSRVLLGNTHVNSYYLIYMSIIIDKNTAKKMVAGASVFSTGGGFEYSAQMKKITKLFKNDNTLSLLSLDELKDDDYICTAYGVGSASNTNVDLSTALKKGLETMKQITNKEFVGIFAGETNIEALVFETAITSGLPVIDADCTGGRAVPEIQFDNLFVVNKSILPLVAVTQKGDTAILRDSGDPEFIEKFVRTIATISKDSVAVIDHPMSVRDAKKYLTQDIFKRSLEVGEIIMSRQKDKFDSIIKATNAIKLGEGIISKVALTDLDGFLEGTIQVKESSGNIYKFYVKNEILVCLKNGEVVATAPDIIALLDSRTGLGIHNSKIDTGTQVAILGVPASPLWRTKGGVDRFNPKSCGYDFPTVLL